MCTRYFCQSDKESTIKIIMLLLVNPVPIFIEFQVQNKLCVLFLNACQTINFAQKSLFTISNDYYYRDVADLRSLQKIRRKKTRPS